MDRRMDRRSGYRQTTVSDRKRIIWMWIRGMSTRVIARESGTSATTVQRWINRFQENGHINRCSGVKSRAVKGLTLLPDPSTDPQTLKPEVLASNSPTPGPSVALISNSAALFAPSPYTIPHLHKQNTNPGIVPSYNDRTAAVSKDELSLIYNDKLNLLRLLHRNESVFLKISEYI